MNRPILVAYTLLLGCLSAAVLYAQPKATPKPVRPTTKPSAKPTIKPVLLPKAPEKLAPKPKQESEKLTPPEKPLEPKDSNDQDYYPYGKLMRRDLTKQGILYTLTGDAQLSHKDVKFLSDTVLYNYDTRIASAPGKLRIEDPQNTLTGNSGVAYYKKELRYADLTGDVKIIARPKQDDPKATVNSLRKEFKSPVTITCDKLRYWWKQKRGFTDTNVKITFTHKDKNWTITGGSLEYFGDTERALLKGNVVAVNDKGERILSDTADITFKEGEEKVILEPVKIGTVIKGDPDEDDGKGESR